MEQKPPPRLFNDLYFPRLPTPQAPNDATWTPFSRLPTELRLHIWLTYLRQLRMIALSLCALDHGFPDPGTNLPAESYYYQARNHRDKVVSGRSYILYMPDAQRYSATTFSPLFWVNSEARQAALSFYHIRLPSPFNGDDQVLYLNAEYDLVQVSLLGSPNSPHPTALLADFLHDVAAFDLKDQG